MADGDVTGEGGTQFPKQQLNIGIITDCFYLYYTLEVLMSQLSDFPLNNE